ncbi:hypothetical protein [Curtobacterium sp. MCBD17_019]|uniref:hypothetical protein n=1 Tax=Curtobacterium sp. MCBD17_019 TaxID=2175669 RepID=UPI0015E8C16E|nr:hypothetical protein [Curtobacterium sp. MCBD17_019]
MKTTASRILIGAATAGAVVALTFGVGATAADAATPTAAPSSSSSSTPSSSSSSATRVALAFPMRTLRAHAVRLETGSVPSALRSDITALKGKKGHDRREAVHAIETKAIGGGYGGAVETIAKEAQTAWASKPAGLEQDRRALKGDSTSERQAGLAAIEVKALKGTYGSAMQHYAQTVKTSIDKHLAATEATSVGAIV